MPLFKSFGKNPTGEALARIQQSKQYRDGNFQNFSPTEMMVRRRPMITMLWKFFNKPASTSPPGTLPAVKTDLKTLDPSKPSIVWFGHSSYLLTLEGKRILVDPVFSGHASPFRFGARSFPGSDIYMADDLPEIDMLLITHDHYDHLDHRTVQRLQPKVREVYTSLGVGSHLAYWGFEKDRIHEFDWGDSRETAGNVTLTAAPARHFSGRSLDRNKTLWASYILQSPACKIYIGADSGYDSHFKNIGQEYGPFDLAILETGQYNEDWPFIHMMPEEAVQASVDLSAKVMLPVHWAKFALSFHDWDEPVKRVLKKAGELQVQVATPRIGEILTIGESLPQDSWWTDL